MMNATVSFAYAHACIGGPRLRPSFPREAGVNRAAGGNRAAPPKQVT